MVVENENLKYLWEYRVARVVEKDKDLKFSLVIQEKMLNWGERGWECYSTQLTTNDYYKGREMLLFFKKKYIPVKFPDDKFTSTDEFGRNSERNFIQTEDVSKIYDDTIRKNSDFKVE